MFFPCTLTSESNFILARIELECRHNKTYRPDTGSKRVVTVKRDYDRGSSGLEENLRDVVWPEDGSSSPAVQTPTITEEDD